MEFVTKSKEETYAIAAKVAGSLKNGDILALSGELGSGKTAFTAGLAKALGISKPVASPTFVLLKEYAIDNKNRTTNVKSDRTDCLVHIDAYRMQSAKDAESIGLADYFERRDIIMVIEWPERIAEMLPEQTKWLKFEYVNNNTRRITIDSIH